jgi:hypothetical protein
MPTNPRQKPRRDGRPRPSGRAKLDDPLESKHSLAGKDSREPSPQVSQGVATAGYSGTPLPKKLGIRENSLVALITRPPVLSESWNRYPREQKSLQMPRGQTLRFFSQLPRQNSSAISARSQKPCLKRPPSGSPGPSKHRESPPTSKKMQSANSASVPDGWLTKCARLMRPGRGCALAEERNRSGSGDCDLPRQ